MDRKSQENLVQYFLVQKLVLWSTSVLEKAEAPVDRKSQENLVQYFPVQKPVLWSTSVLEKTAYEISCGTSRKTVVL